MVDQTEKIMERVAGETTLQGDALETILPGSIVEVMPRHWPGINKPGGVGRVMASHFDEEEECWLYDIVYIVVHGREDRVHERFVRTHVAESGARKVRGRCRICGSFLRDCKHNPVNAGELRQEIKAKPTTFEGEGKSKSIDDYESDDGDDDEDNPAPSDQPIMPSHHKNLVDKHTVSSSVESSQVLSSSDAEKVKVLHKTLFETCLENNEENDEAFINNASLEDNVSFLSPEYIQALNELKELSAEQCWELMKLCYNFVANMKIRGDKLMEQRQELGVCILDSTATEKLELAEWLISLDERQEKLIRQIERAGFDVFNKAEKVLLSKLRRSRNKRVLRQQCESLSLKVSGITSMWSITMKDARREMIALADNFAEKFGQCAEDVLDGVDRDDASVESADSEKDTPRLQNDRNRKVSGRERDAALEASTLRRNGHRSTTQFERRTHNRRASKSSAGRKQLKASSAKTDTTLPHTSSLSQIRSGHLEQEPSSVTISSHNNPPKSIELEVSTDRELLQVLNRKRKARQLDRQGRGSKRRRSVYGSKARSSAERTSLEESCMDSDQEFQALKSLKRRRYAAKTSDSTHRRLTLLNSRNYEDAVLEYSAENDFEAQKSKRPVFFRHVSPTVDPFVSYDGRVVVLENDRYLADPSNLNLPLTTSALSLFSDRLADRLICVSFKTSQQNLQWNERPAQLHDLKDTNEDVYDLNRIAIASAEDADDSLDDYFRKFSHVDAMALVDSSTFPQISREICIRFLLDAQSAYQLDLSMESVFVSGLLDSYVSCVSDSLQVKLQSTLSALHSLRTEEARLKIAARRDRSTVVHNYLPAFAQSFALAREHLLSCTSFALALLFSDLQNSYLRSRLFSATTKGADHDLLILKHTIECSLNSWSKVECSLTSSFLALQSSINQATTQVPSLLILCLQSTMNFDKYSALLQKVSLHCLLSRTQWCDSTLQKIAVALSTEPTTDSSLRKAISGLSVQLFVTLLHQVKEVMSLLVCDRDAYLNLQPTSRNNILTSNHNATCDILTFVTSSIRSFVRAQEQITKLQAMLPEVGSVNNIQLLFKCKLWEVLNMAILDVGKRAIHQWTVPRITDKLWIYRAQPLISETSISFEGFSSLNHDLNMEALWSCIALLTKYLSTHWQVNRVSHHWPLIHALCQKILPALPVTPTESNSSLVSISPATSATKVCKDIVRMLQRVAELALLWDSAGEAHTLFLDCLVRLDPILRRISPTLLSRLVSDHLGKRIVDDNMAMQNGSVLFPSSTRFNVRSALVISAYLHHTLSRRTYSVAFNWIHARHSLHKYLLMIVSLLFTAYQLPNPLLQLCVAQFSSDSGAQQPLSFGAKKRRPIWDEDDDDGENEDEGQQPDQSEVDASLLSALASVYKLLLYNMTSESNVKTCERTTTPVLLKRLEMYAHTERAKLLGIFERQPHFISGGLLCLLIKELESSLGLQCVRHKLKMAEKLLNLFIEAPLQQPLQAPQQSNGLASSSWTADVSVNVADRQRSGLIFLASLVIFNPFPIPTSRLSPVGKASSVPLNPFADLKQMEKDDQDSLQSFLQLVQLVQQMCTNCLLDFGQLTEEVETLLFASIVTCNAVVNHLNHCYQPRQQWQHLFTTPEVGAEQNDGNYPQDAKAVLRTFPVEILTTTLHLLSTLLQLTSTTTTTTSSAGNKEVLKSKRNLAETMAFSTYTLCGVVRFLHGYVLDLLIVDDTILGITDVLDGAYSQVASVFHQIYTLFTVRIKGPLLAQLRRTKETAETFSVHLQSKQDARFYSSDGNPTQSTLSPQHLQRLLENQPYLFATSTSKLIEPATQLLTWLYSIAVHVNAYHACQQRQTEATTASTAGLIPSPDSVWRALYSSSLLSVPAGSSHNSSSGASHGIVGDSFLSEWMKMLWWQNLLQEILSLCADSALSAFESSLLLFRQAIVQQLPDLLHLLLTLEPINTCKARTVLGFSVADFIDLLCAALRILDLLSNDQLNTAITQRTPLTLGPTEQLILLTLERYVAISTSVDGSQARHDSTAPNAKEDTSILLQALLFTLFEWSTRLSQSGLTANVFWTKANHLFFERVLQNYLRALRFLTLCRFQQTTNQNNAQIISSQHHLQRLSSLIIVLVEQRMFSSSSKPLLLAHALPNMMHAMDPRIELSTVVSFFTDCVHPQVKTQLAEVIQLLQVHRSQASTQSQGQSNAVVQQVLDDYLQVLPHCLAVVLCVPFATRCTEWQILLEILLVAFHPRVENNIIFHGHRQMLLNGWARSLRATSSTSTSTSLLESVLMTSLPNLRTYWSPSSSSSSHSSGVAGIPPSQDPQPSFPRSQGPDRPAFPGHQLQHAQQQFCSFLLPVTTSSAPKATSLATSSSAPASNVGSSSSMPLWTSALVSLEKSLFGIERYVVERSSEAQVQEIILRVQQALSLALLQQCW